MQSRISLSILLIVSLFAGTLCAQENAVLPEGEGGLGNDIRSFPYSAELTGGGVYIRSGPGTNFYECGQLDEGYKVKVVSAQHGWSCIVPVEGSFSWISKQYVTVDPNKPKTGVITGDSVSVYTGSENVQPLYSTTRQGKLDSGDKVSLLGEEKDGYYKIAPPEFAYLWISSRYLKPLDSSVETLKSVKTKSKPEVTVLLEQGGAKENKKLEEYYTLEKQVKAEAKKPIGLQDYSKVKEQMQKLAGDKGAGKASRYAEFTLKRIECCELALKVEKQLQMQDKKLQNIENRIARAHAEKLSQVQDLGKFAVVGTLRTSEVYGSEEALRHYRIVEQTGSTVCYALPTGRAKNMDLEKFIGKKVGLVGTILPHQQTNEALVKFTDIQVIR